MTEHQRSTPPRDRETGFSLIEILFALVLFAVIVLGILPLFTRSMVNNAMGQDSTQISSHATSRTEELYQALFDHPSVTIPGGATEVMATTYWDPTTKTFITTAPSSGPVPRWERTTRVRQFGIGDLDDGVLDNPLDGDTDPAFVHLKEVEVVVETAPQGPVLPGRRLVVKSLKPF